MKTFLKEIFALDLPKDERSKDIQIIKVKQDFYYKKEISYR